MSYRRTKELVANRSTPRGGSPTKSNISNKSPARTTANMKKPLAPEDNWDLVANPSVLFDELPQPYRFVNKCLTELILKPVNQAITKIEERKKTTEYEGFIKETGMTGNLDLDACTCIEKIGTLVGPGGVVNKEEQGAIPYKVLAGDNFGQLILIDVQRKNVLDRF